MSEIAETDIVVTEQEREQRDQFIQGLRDCADFLVAHPDVPAPRWITLNVFVNTKAEIARIARLATWEKSYQSTWFALVREFSPHLKMEINTERENMCRRVVVGTEVVPAQPERTIELVEWVCEESVLA